MKLLKSALYAKQREGARRALEHDGFSLWMEQGTGKTITALKVIAVRWRRHSARLVLVVGPKIVPGSWAKQIEEHLNVPHQIIRVKRRKVKESLKEIDHSEWDGLRFVLVNYELLWRYQRLFLKLKWDFVVSDESHRLKKHTSRQSRSMRRIARIARFRLALTGTPIGKDERDLYAQLDYTHPDFFGAWRDFEKKYMRKPKIYKPDGSFWFKPRLRSDAPVKLAKLVAPYCFRVEAKEMTDLPPVTHRAVYFPLTGKAAKAYQDMERDYIAEFGDFKSTAELAIVKRIRLSQLTGGYLGLDDGSLLRLERDKLAHLEDWLEDFPAGEKLVIFARHTHEVDDIAGLLKRRKMTFVIRDGRTKPKDLDAWKIFQSKPNPQVYLAQIGAGGIGIDLYAARFGVFYSISDSWIEYSQALKRIDRTGQRRPVVLTHFIAENTIDEDRYDLLDETRLTSAALMRRIKERNKTMAKKDKAAKAEEAATEEKTETKKKAPPPRQSAEFGPPKLVAALKEMGVELDAGEVRAYLRSDEDLLEKYKDDSGWDFKNQKTIDAVAAKVKAMHEAKQKRKAEKAAAEASKDEPAESEEKPAAKKGKKGKKED